MTDHPPLPKYPVSSAPEGSPRFDPRRMPPPSNTRAGWALGLCLFPGVITIIVGVALAIFVLIDTARDGRDHGKGMAIGALCAAGAWVVAFSAIGIYFLTAGVERDAEGDVLESGRVRVGELKVGDCLPDPPGDGTQLFVDVVPCGDPHRGEVFARFDIRTFTSLDEESAEIDDGCLEGYQDNVGAAPMDPTFEVYVLQPPDRGSFDENPVVACLGFVVEPVTGRLRESGGQPPGLRPSPEVAAGSA